MIEQSKKYKIAIVAYNLNVGGLAKVTLNLFSLLQGDERIDVQLLLLDGNDEEQTSDRIINFGTYAKGNDTVFKKLNKYFQFKKYLKQENFTFIIDLRYRINPISEIVITKFLYPKTNIIYTVHSAKLETYLFKNTFFTKWLYGSAYKIVCGAKANEEVVLKRHKLKNTLPIYNPLDFYGINIQKLEELVIDFEYIVVVGRIVELKQFDKLIEAYSNTILPSKKIKLVIVGDGENLGKLKTQVFNLKLQHDVVFIGHTDNPYQYMKNAKFLILCSVYEGFGLVLAEALACGTPVISFDLVSGPNEIIDHEVNGLLVANQNFDKLTEAINLFIEDEALYQHCKSNAVASVQQFSMENIRKQWLNLMKITA